MVRVVCFTQMPHQSPIHLHLDAVGGVAGDMFVAALLDAAPDLEAELLRALDQAGLNTLVRVQRFDHDDGTLTGSKVSVTPVSDAAQNDLSLIHISEPTRPY